MHSPNEPEKNQFAQIRNIFKKSKYYGVELVSPRKSFEVPFRASFQILQPNAIEISNFENSKNIVAILKFSIFLSTRSNDLQRAEFSMPLNFDQISRVQKLKKHAKYQKLEFSLSKAKITLFQDGNIHKKVDLLTDVTLKFSRDESLPRVIQPSYPFTKHNLDVSISYL
jgi:hypothetical protein